MGSTQNKQAGIAHPKEVLGTRTHYKQELLALSTERLQTTMDVSTDVCVCVDISKGVIQGYP